MRIFRSECPPDYNTYTFSYAEYAVLEEQDFLSDIYDGGFLPYTGDTSIREALFYRCRSVRVNLSEYASSSENRRVDRKIQPLQWNMVRTSKPVWEDLDPAHKNLALEYARARFSTGEMTVERLRYIYKSPAATDMFIFDNGKDVIGFVLAGMDDKSLHYWFAFFDWSKMTDAPLGKWMMWKVIEWAKEHDRRFVYLGTCYGKKSLYKVRDFKGIEFFNGNEWVADKEVLKELCELDARSDRVDLFKYYRSIKKGK